jgi:hypothetical protein
LSNFLSFQEQIVEGLGNLAPIMVSGLAEVRSKDEVCHYHQYASLDRGASSTDALSGIQSLDFKYLKGFHYPLH